MSLVNIYAFVGALVGVSCGFITRDNYLLNSATKIKMI
jgi:hypothetical protein